MSSNDFSLVFGTNIWSHHQVPLARELVRLLGEDRFQMVLFEDVPEDRRALGWADATGCPWVAGPPHGSQALEQLARRCIDADVMVFGACPQGVLASRRAAGKLTLVASERILKAKRRFHQLRLLNPRYALGTMRYRDLRNDPHVHALAIGHHAPADLAKVGVFGDRVWKWGYFVDVNSVPPQSVLDRPLRILWVGRMLRLKRIDVLLRAIARLDGTPVVSQCEIRGDGPERSNLERLAQRLGLGAQSVRFLPAVRLDEVRELMRDSDVYVLPSDRHEGWGAVAGEAMSEGCVLVANDQAGASRDLIVDGETGFLFRDGDVCQLASVLSRLANDYSLRMKVRQQAWERMSDVWNPRVAAERLVALISGLLRLSPMPEFIEGPCSPCAHRTVRSSLWR